MSMNVRLALVAMLSLAGACAASKAAVAPPAPMAAGVAASPSGAPPATTQQAAAAAVAPGGAPKAIPDATVANAYVIYTGNVAMLEEQEAMPALVDKIVDVAEAMGGRLHARRDDGVSIRVPSTRFREAMSKLDGLGTVTHRSVKADDVSEEFHDAEVRLQNLKATRQRLQELLAKAHSVAETLVVERELERVAQEIDRLQGRVRFLSDRATLSTIDVTIAAKPKPAVVVAAPRGRRKLGIELPIGWLARVDADQLSKLK
jgi:hypothetical protein